MNFETALVVLKIGGRIIRPSWPVGTYLDIELPTQNNELQHPYIKLTKQKTPSHAKTEHVWKPKRDDLLAEDWFEI